MTAVNYSYRIRIYEAGDPNTVDFDLALADISGPPIVTGLITHPTAGRTEMRPFTVLAIDNDGILSASLTEQSGGFGRWQALGRRVDVQFSQDGGAFTSYGTGRISRLEEADGPGRYRIEVSDESWLARKAKIFSVADTTQLWPAPPYVFTWPSGLPTKQQDAVTEHFLNSAADASSLTDCIRAIASAFAFVARQPAVTTVSRAIEVGCTFQGRARYLRADSERLLRMSEKAIAKLLRDPPSSAAPR